MLSGPGEVWEWHPGLGLVEAFADHGGVERTEA